MIREEDKKLLLQDLCTRLPYGIKVKIPSTESPLTVLSINTNGVTWVKGDNGYPFEIDWENCKPLLFPLSSMTKEQKNEFDQLLELELKALNDEINHTQATEFEVDFYNKHNLDWRGLIPKGLAIDCTNLNIY